MSRDPAGGGLPTPAPFGATAPAGGALRALLADGAFRNVWLSGASAGVMRWLDVLTVGVYVFQVTRSPLAVSLMLFLRMLPMFLFGAFTGAVAEAFDPRRLLMASLVFLAVVYGVLGVLVATDQAALWHVGLAVFLSGVYWAFELPVRRTMLGELAGPDRIGAAMAMDSATNNATRMLGPLIGGLLLELLGLHGGFLLGAVLYVIAAALMLIVPPGVGRSGTAKLADVFRNIAAGVAYVRSNRVVQAVFAITIATNLFGFSYNAMIPVIGEERLGLSAFPIGVLMAMEGLGALIGALWIAVRAPPRRFLQLFWGGSCLYMAAVFVFSRSPWFELTLPVMFLGGLGIAGFAAMQSALILTHTPREMRVRVMGVLVMCIGAGPIGILHVGALADRLGADRAVALASLEGLVLLLLAGLVWPELRRGRDLRPRDHGS